MQGFGACLGLTLALLSVGECSPTVYEQGAMVRWASSGRASEVRL